MGPPCYTASRESTGVRSEKINNLRPALRALSAFNHTLCEQNIKTCPFVYRRRAAACGGGGGGGGGSGAAAGGRPSVVTISPTQ